MWVSDKERCAELKKALCTAHEKFCFWPDSPSPGTYLQNFPFTISSWPMWGFFVLFFCLFVYLFLIGVQLLYNVVLVSAVQRSESAICIHISPLLDFLPIQVTTEHWVEFPMLYSRFSLVIYFIHISVYMSIPISQFIPTPSHCISHIFFFLQKSSL